MTEPAPDRPAPGSTPPQGPSGPRTSFGRRLAAYLVDAVVLAVVYLVIFVVTNETVASFVNLVAGLAYFGYFEGSASGQTVGKKLLGVRVIDFRSGGPIGFGRALIRYIGKLISSIPCLLGFLWMLWDREKQTWHDKIATTVVVPESAYPVQSWPA